MKSIRDQTEYQVYFITVRNPISSLARQHFSIIWQEGQRTDGMFSEGVIAG